MLKDTSAQTMTDGTFSYGFFFYVLHSYTLNEKSLQSPDTNITFVVSERGKIIKIIKSALLKVS